MATARTAAASKKTSTTDAVGRRNAKKGEPQFANYTEKGIPTRIQEFADWLTAETGYEVDARSVYLGSALRGTFQKSDENQARIANRITERAAEIEAREQRKLDRAAEKELREKRRAEAAEERETAKAERAAAREKAAEEKAAAKAAKAAEPKAEKAPAKTAAKAPAKGRAAAAKPAAKATPATTRRRPARGAAAAKGGEDF